MDSTRQKKISRLIQKELAEIFRAMGPEIIHGTMVTVTTGRVSSDLSVAKVYLSFFPSGKAEAELAFFIDDSLDYIDKIDSLLKPE